MSKIKLQISMIRCHLLIFFFEKRRNKNVFAGSERSRSIYRCPINRIIAINQHSSGDTRLDVPPCHGHFIRHAEITLASQCSSHLTMLYVCNRFRHLISPEISLNHARNLQSSRHHRVLWNIRTNDLRRSWNRLVIHF